MKFTRTGLLQVGKLKLSWRLGCGTDFARPWLVTPRTMTTFAGRISGDTAIGSWRGHRRLGAEFTVTVRFRLRRDGALTGTIAYGNAAGLVPISEIHFPVVSVRTPETADFFYPHSQGFVLPDITGAPTGTVSYSELKSMQYCAILAGSESVYCGFHDPRLRVKLEKLDLAPSRRALRLCGIHPVAMTARSRKQGRLPFPCVVQPFSGGWYEAAMHYRRWALRQWWARRNPAPNPRRDLALWAWNRGTSDAVIAPLEQFTRDTGLPAALDWYSWHRCGFDTDYPDFWPPREGEAAFTAALARLKKAGIFVQVYVNGMAWDVAQKDWAEHGDAAVVVRADGQAYVYEFNVHNHHQLAYICGESRKFPELLGGVIAKLAATGIPGIYLDMIQCAANRIACYNPAHRHAPGGGDFNVRNYRRQVKSLRETYPDIRFSSEECGEAFMDLFDSLIVLNASAERLKREAVRVVPAFSAVYHGKVALFGNYALVDGVPYYDSQWPPEGKRTSEPPWHREFPEQFFVEVARGVLWGMQPTVCGLQLKHTTEPEYRELYDFIIATARFYHAHREWLFDGRMLAPGELECATVAIAFCQRTIYTPAGRERAIRVPLPAVLHSRWQAPAGPKALFLCNPTATAQHYRDATTGCAGTIPPRSWELRRY